MQRIKIVTLRPFKAGNITLSFLVSFYLITENIHLSGILKIK